MDLVAFGAHPDDCELLAGGLLALLCEAGWRVALCDLTRGEAGTRGSPEERAAEAVRGAEILGAAERVTLDLGDAGLENTAESRRAVVEVLRRFRPPVVLTHWSEDMHTDHPRAHRLVKEACYLSGIGGYEAEGERLETRPSLFYYFGYPGSMAFHPDFIVPIDSAMEKKRRAIAAYASQFHNPNYDKDAPKTTISSPDFLEALEARCRVWGQAVGARYGEAYVLERAPRIDDPLQQIFGLSRPG